MSCFEFAYVPDVILKHPPCINGELSAFELKVAVTLLELARLARVVDLEKRRSTAAQEAIAAKRQSTDNGAEIRKAASRARKEIKESDEFPKSFEVHVAARELLRCMGLAPNTSKARLHAALDRLSSPVQLPIRGPRLPRLVHGWSKSRTGIILQINMRSSWFPGSGYHRINLPLPVISGDKGANILALYLLSQTWQSNSSRVGLPGATIMKRLATNRWRSVVRALDSLNKYLRAHDLPVWKLAEREDGNIVFRHATKPSKPVFERQVCTLKAPIKRRAPSSLGRLGKTRKRKETVHASSSI